LVATVANCPLPHSQVSLQLASRNQKLAGTQNEKSLTCDDCCKSFAHLSSLSRHKKRCEVKKSKIDELEKLKKENIYIKNEYKQIKKNNNDLLEINKNATKANKFAMSTFNTLANQYVKAPALRKIEVLEIQTIMYQGVKDDELIEGLIYYNRNNRLVKYIGNAIVSSYKKDNPQDQSFWNSDTQRLTYIIRSLANDNLCWVRNNGGTQVLEYIIQPILDYLDKEIRNHIKTTPKSLFSNIVEYNNHMMDAHILSTEFADKKELGDKVLAYISPFFHFRRSDQIEFFE